MINEELKQQIEQLEQQIKDLKVKLEKEVEEEPYEVKLPKNIEDYVYINNVGNIYNLNILTISGIEEIYKRGLTFKTVEEVEQYDKERILLFKLHKWAEEQNEGWTPNWKKGDEIKYFIIYDNQYETLKVDNYATIKEFCKLPYFKSEEIAKQFIEEFGEEIKEVLL